MKKILFSVLAITIIASVVIAQKTELKLRVITSKDTIYISDVKEFKLVPVVSEDPAALLDSLYKCIQHDNWYYTKESESSNDGVNWSTFSTPIDALGNYDIYTKDSTFSYHSNGTSPFKDSYHISKDGKQVVQSTGTLKIWKLTMDEFQFSTITLNSYGQYIRVTQRHIKKLE
jgi:hypothetical protein